VNRFKTGLQKLGVLEANPVEGDLQRTLIGRVVSALTFVAVVLCLGVWITAFLLFRQSGLQANISTNLFTDLSCVTFFGGLVIAIGAGAMAGNFLRRVLWKRLTNRNN
jgi:hypothetical protein